MQKILRKRVLRDLKDNCFRYLALGFMIVLGMYLVISLVGAAETVIGGVDAMAEKHQLEEGEFGVFVPLTLVQEEELRDKGITLESMFYMDYLMKDASTIRVFKNRMEINLIALDKGRMAESMKEAVIEKRYSEEHSLSLGDSISIGKDSLKIVGIGSVPDYDAPLKSVSDSSADSSRFGLVFVTREQYEKLKAAGNSVKTEEYVYAYRLEENMTDDELKDDLNKLDFDAKEVSDPYFLEYWEATAGKKEDIREGIEKLKQGSSELKDALAALKNNNGNIRDGAAEIFDTYLKDARDGLAAYGYQKELTAENYQAVLQGYMDSTDNGLIRIKLDTLLNKLKELNDFQKGMNDYTDGVAESSKATSELSEGMGKLKENADELLNKYFNMDISNLTQFIAAEDNPRIKASSEDQIINKLSGLISGVIVMILFTYVISVFVIHGIEKESSVIGTLYALGVKKKELMLHYLTLPVVITLIAGICGTLIGFSRYGVDVQMEDCYTYFSLPQLDTLFPAYLLIYGILMPPAVAAFVNYFTISKKLSQPALKMIRNEQKNSAVSNINLGNMGFMGRFRIRQMLREARTGFTVIFGMFISLLIMMMGIDGYVLCNYISVENKADTKYEYLYTLKYPQNQIPAGGEACYAETLSKDAYGNYMDVTLLGIDDNNPYFEADTVEGRNKVVVASATVERFHLKIGDKLVLEDKANEVDYAFTVAGIAAYSVGLHVFMDIDSMRKLFGQEDDYYNTVLSSKKLNLDAGRLYAVTTKTDICKSSDVFFNKMTPMFVMLITVSAIMFCVVMYLMMKVMIDRAAYSISLMKIFGYRTREVRRLYLNGNFYIITAGAIIGIPLAKRLMDLLYPYLVSNVACSINLTFSRQLYLGIFAGVLCLYFMINQLLVGRLKRLIPAEVLKNCE